MEPEGLLPHSQQNLLKLIILFPVRTPTWKVILQQPEDMAESYVISYDEERQIQCVT